MTHNGPNGLMEKRKTDFDIFATTVIAWTPEIDLDSKLWYKNLLEGVIKGSVGFKLCKKH